MEVDMGKILVWKTECKYNGDCNGVYGALLDYEGCNNG